MPQYSYTAKSLSGEEKSGTLEAKDMHQLVRALRNEGLILIRADSEAKMEKRRFKISLPFLNSVSLAEKMFFTRNLQIMINAGTPLLKAIGTLASQTKNSTFKKALLDIREQIGRGKTFSENLSKYPSIFSEIFQSMVKVGEESGTLDEVLKTLEKRELIPSARNHRLIMEGFGSKKPEISDDVNKQLSEFETLIDGKDEIELTEDKNVKIEKWQIPQTDTEYRLKIRRVCRALIKTGLVNKDRFKSIEDSIEIPIFGVLEKR